MDKQIDGSIDSQTDRQIDRQIDILMSASEGLSCRTLGRKKERQINREMERKKNRQNYYPDLDVCRLFGEEEGGAVEKAVGDGRGVERG